MGTVQGLSTCPFQSWAAVGGRRRRPHSLSDQGARPPRGRGRRPGRARAVLSEPASPVHAPLILNLTLTLTLTPTQDSALVERVCELGEAGISVVEIDKTLHREQVTRHT